MENKKHEDMARNRMEMLGSILNVINSTLDIHRILEMIMDNAMELMGAERGFIMLIDPFTYRLEFKIARNLDKRRLESEELEISRSIVQDVFSTGKAVLTHNAAEDPRYMESPSIRAFGLRSVISVPLIVKGDCVGVIYLDNRFKFGVFEDHDLDFMKIFADEIALAMDNARLEEERTLIKDLFRHYVSPEVAEEIIKRGPEFNLRGERKEVSVFFADIRGFSALSEKINPQELMAQLNECFEEMGKIIFDRRGTLMKYLGDGMMVTFGAPLSEEDDAIRAVGTGKEMLEILKVLNSKWKQEGKPLLKMGIGMDSGEALAGTIGCYERREYTVIGDVPNTASRLEKLNKEYGTSFIISEETYKRVKNSFVAHRIGVVTLQGKEVPVTVYKVL